MEGVTMENEKTKKKHKCNDPTSVVVNTCLVIVLILACMWLSSQRNQNSMASANLHFLDVTPIVEKTRRGISKLSYYMNSTAIRISDEGIDIVRTYTA